MNEVPVCYQFEIVLFTWAVIEEASAAKSEGIQLTGIGVGGMANKRHLDEQLEDLASYPPSINVLSVDDFDDLASVKEDICLDCSGECLCLIL